MIKLVHVYVAVAILMLSHCKSTTLPNLGANDDQGISTSDLEGVTSSRAKGRDRIQYQFDLIHRTYTSVTHFNEMPQKMLQVDLRATFMHISHRLRRRQRLIWPQNWSRNTPTTATPRSSARMNLR